MRGYLRLYLRAYRQWLCAGGAPGSSAAPPWALLLCLDGAPSPFCEFPGPKLPDHPPCARGGPGPRLPSRAAAGSAYCAAGQYLSGCGGTSPGTCTACLSCATACGGSSAGFCLPGADSGSGSSSSGGGGDDTPGVVYLAVLAVIPIGLVIFCHCYVRRIADRDRKAEMMREEMLREQGLAYIQLVNSTGGAVQVATRGASPRPAGAAQWSRAPKGRGRCVTGVPSPQVGLVKGNGVLSVGYLRPVGAGGGGQEREGLGGDGGRRGREGGREEECERGVGTKV